LAAAPWPEAGASPNDISGIGLTQELHGNRGKLKAVSPRGFTGPEIAREWRASRFGGVEFAGKT